MSSMLRKHYHHKRSHGVGLVDVLIAVVIISGGLVAMGRLQGASATSSAVAGQQSEAGFIAQKVIEDLRAKSWTSIVPGSYTLQPQVGRSATYNINYTVTESMSGGPLFKTVIATVSWNDSSNQLQKSTITTRFQENGAAGTVRMLGMNTSGCSSSSGSSSSSSGSSSSASKSGSQSSESKKCTN
jgi:Tfp pilus assembly protein PilV